MLWINGRSDNGRRCQADANHRLTSSFDMNILGNQKETFAKRGLI